MRILHCLSFLILALLITAIMLYAYKRVTGKLPSLGPYEHTEPTGWKRALITSVLSSVGLYLLRFVFGLRYPGVSVSIIAILSLASGIFLGGRLGNIIFKPLGIEGVGEKFGSMIGIGIGFVIMNGVLPELGKVFLQP